MQEQLLSLKECRRPAVRVKFDKGVSMNKLLMNLLGSPRNLHLWWGEDNGLLFISSSREKTKMSFSISYTGNRGFCIESKYLLQALSERANLNRKHIYRCEGEYIPELDMVMFKLHDSEKAEVGENVQDEGNGGYGI